MLNYLLGVDINTQQSFEALNQRAVAVVIDPVQSAKCQRIRMWLSPSGEC